MNKVCYKIMSVIMSFVVLFSTMSFTIDMHYCGDTLMDTALFQKAKTCDMDPDSPDSYRDREETAITSSKCSMTKKNCCKEEQIVVKGQDELKISFEKLSFDQHIFVAQFTFSYINLFEGLPQQIIPYKNYTPPLLVKDLPVLNDTFLI